MAVHCDFCDGSNPTKSYDCKGFVFTVVIDAKHVTSESTGAWLACDACAKLVDAGEWEALADRATARYPLDKRPIYRELARQFHKQFQIHRLRIN